MDICGWYNKINKPLPSSENRNDRQVNGSSMTIIYCSHECADNLSRKGTSTLGNNKILKCEGQFPDKCQIPKEKMAKWFENWGK